MNCNLALAGLLALGSAPALVAQDVAAQKVKTVTVDAVVKIADTTNRDAPPPVTPISESVPLSKLVPKGGAVAIEDGWFGTCTLGGKTVNVAVGKSDAGLELPDLLCVDLNGDGTFSADEKMPIEASSQDARGTQLVRAQPVEASFQARGASLPVRASFMRMGDRDPQVSLQFPQYLEAAVEIAGTEHVVAVLDKDFDGTFGSGGDLWALGVPGGRPASPYGLLGMAERAFQDGTLVGVKIDGEKVEVTTTPADGPDPADAKAQRVRVEHIWTERFDAERDGFIAQRKLDTSRPLATEPIEWRYVTLEQALALGAESGKPVFVDVMAFWCVWCYRMDYYTYPDAEVAKVLSEEYIPVKIIQEQDAAGDYDKLMKEKLEARGIPAMGIFSGDGTVLHKIGGWKSPEDFLTDLRTGLKAAKGGN